MNRIDLIKIADYECVSANHTIRGWCSIDGQLSVMCTRDDEYKSRHGAITDCIYAENTTKANCKHWHRIGKPISPKERVKRLDSDSI